MFLRVALIIAVAAVLQSANGFQNPVITTTKKGSFQGTSILKYNDVYHLITVDKNYQFVQTRTSSDLQNWTDPKTILGPNDAADWMPGIFGFIYEPSTLTYINGQFVLYIGTLDPCIAYATAKDINGPYKVEEIPLLCYGTNNETSWFSHPAVFADNGTIYLYYVHLNHGKTAVEVRPLSADGLTFPDQDDVAVVVPPGDVAVNAPTVVKYQDYYYVVYEVACQGLFVARSLSPMGPFEKRGDTPIVPYENGELKDPRHSALVNDAEGNTVLVYASGKEDCNTVKFYVSVDNLEWDSDLWPVVVNVK